MDTGSVLHCTYCIVACCYY